MPYLGVGRKPHWFLTSGSKEPVLTGAVLGGFPKTPLPLDAWPPSAFLMPDRVSMTEIGQGSGLFLTPLAFSGIGAAVGVAGLKIHADPPRWSTSPLASTQDARLPEAQLSGAPVSGVGTVLSGASGWAVGRLWVSEENWGWESDRSPRPRKLWWGSTRKEVSKASPASDFASILEALNWEIASLRALKSNSLGISLVSVFAWCWKAGSETGGNGCWSVTTWLNWAVTDTLLSEESWSESMDMLSSLTTGTRESYKPSTVRTKVSCNI